MDLLKSMAMDSSMPKWGCRKKCTPRLPVDQAEVNKNVDDVGQQPKQGDEKDKQPQKRLILRIKQGERAIFIANDEKSGPPKPCHQPPPLPELVDEDDPNWKEQDAKKEESKGRCKRKRKTEEDDKTKKEKKKEIPRERPEFLFRLTQEQVAKDFKLFITHAPSLRSCRPRPTFGVLRPREFVASKNLLY